MVEDLVSKLRSALLHQVRLDPVPWQEHVRENDPTLAYISQMLLDDDQDEQQQQQQPPQLTIHLNDSYIQLMAELAILLAPSPDQALRSASAKNATCPGDLTAWLKLKLIDAAKAVTKNQGSDVYRIISEVRKKASLQGSSAERTALFFADALLARFTGFGSQVYTAMLKGIDERHSVHVRLLNLPCLRVSQRFANCNILNLCEEQSRIHIIDYGIHYGCQWPMLIKLLSQRPRGPPAMKITGVDFPSVDLKETGRNLIEFARSCGVLLQFEAIGSSSWELVHPRIHVEDYLVVNCNLRLRHLREEGSVGYNPRKLFFEKIRSLKPDLLIQGIMEAAPNFSSPFFMQRFEGSLDVFFNRMDMFEGLLAEDKPEEYEFMASIQAKAVMNVVACEGVERVERLNSYRSWDARASRAGFELLPLRSDTMEGIRDVCCSSMKNARFGDLKLGIDGNWLLLGWKNHVVHAMSTWKIK